MSPNVIDLLSLDVEGFELQVLEGLDHEKYRFRFICVESRNPELMKKYLARQSYFLIATFQTGDLFYE